MIYSISINEFAGYYIQYTEFVPLICEGSNAAEALACFLDTETFVEDLNKLCKEDHAVSLQIVEKK